MSNYFNNTFNNFNNFNSGYRGGGNDSIAFLRGLIGGLIIGNLIKQLLGGGGYNLSSGFDQNQSDSYNFGSGFGDDYNSDASDTNFNFDF